MGCLCQWELKAPTDRSRSDCVHEQVAKRIANVRFTVRLEEMYDAVEIGNVKGIAWFVCRKGENYESEL